ncbi:MAG: prepilin-type N-terminal cleavage/methylation domain-containing protein [Lachnospiraceae bacterium]|nr:prepilin-type N-terminal cleavage/methylation domain-containing protein [Lachnospiraceae bacterium]
MKKKMNNKGFSLVELIIVVAIMVVLVGVLAPQYLRYVEQSRQSADLDNYDTIISAIEIWAADPTHTWTNGTLTVEADGDVLATGSVQAALVDAGIFTSTPGANPGDPATITSNVTMRSAAFQDATIAVERDTTTGLYTYTFGATNGAALETALGR